MRQSMPFSKTPISGSPARLFQGHISWPWIIGLLSMGAAAIHFAVIPEHFNEWGPFGWFFVVVAWTQAVGAMLIITKPARWLLVVALAGNLVLAGLFFWTRLDEVPIGPDAGSPESFGWPGIVTVIFELAIVVIAAALLWQPGWSSRWHLPTVSVIGAAIVLAGVIGVALGYG